MTKLSNIAKDMTGERHGRLVVLERHGTNADNRATWRCACDCGNEVVKPRPYIMSSPEPSCGCIFKKMVSKRGQNNRTHGETSTRLYTIWKGMKYRCRNERDKNYKYYGGRGIDVIDEWYDSYEVFRDWAHENGYSETLSVDRIDNDKGYNPENCRWADITTQNRNRSNSVSVNFEGKKRTIKEVAKETNENEQTVWARHYRGANLRSGEGGTR